MRKSMVIFISIFFSFFMLPVAEASTTPTETISNPVQLVIDKFSSLSLKDAQKLAGRKFTLKEKLGFLLLKQQIKKGQKKGFSKTLIFKVINKKSKKADEPGSKGQSALVFGIASLVILILGFFIPYVILVSPLAAIFAIVLGTIAQKKDKDDTKGRIGKLLGWISLGLFALFLLVAALILSGSGWI